MTKKKLALIGGGVGLVLLYYLGNRSDYRTMKEDIKPDELPVPGKTGYKLVDKLLPKLTEISKSTGIPLGLMVAWIAKESGGKLSSHTSLDERGYYQLMPAESKSLGLDHQRLSTDSDYSLDAGTKLIRKYQSVINDLNIASAPAGSALYWLLVKCAHTVGEGQTRKWVKAAQAAGKMDSWSDFSDFVLGQSWRGPQPKKWIPFLSAIYKLGKPFGWGSESGGPLIVGYTSETSDYIRGIELDFSEPATAIYTPDVATDIPREGGIRKTDSDYIRGTDALIACWG